MELLCGLVSVLMLLSPSGCADPLPVTTEKNVSPIVDMKLDPRKKTLTWSYQTEVTQQECKIDTPPRSSTRQSPQKTGVYSCRFPNAVLNRGATLTLDVTAGGVAFRRVLDFRNPGREGSGAVNFSCLIYNVELMDCSWAPGPAAPADVRYHLYSWTDRNDRDNDEAEAECPDYMLDTAGTRVGCHFERLPEPHRTDVYFFLVNGTSKETAIPFLDFPPFRAIQMEKLNPPANVTVQYNGSHHIICWNNPKMRFDLPSSVLRYELNIRRKGSLTSEDPVSQRGRDANAFVMPGLVVRGEHTVRVRGKSAHSALWSDWSPALHFGHPEKEDRSTPMFLAALLAGTAAVVIAVLPFLSGRCPLRRKLCPAVPQAKTELVGASALCPKILWDPDNPPPSSQEPEDILVVQETQPFTSREAEAPEPASLHPQSENISSERSPLSAV